MARLRLESTSATDVSGSTVSELNPSQSETSSSESEANQGDTTNDTVTVAGDIDTAGSGGSVDSGGDSGTQDSSGSGAVSGGGNEVAESGNQDTDRERAGERREPASGDDEGTQDSSYRSPQRAAYLRKKRRRGIELRDDEASWLEDYEANVKRGRRPKEDTDTRNETPPTVLQSGGKRVPKPPIIHESKTWRKKYSGDVDTGRELICVTVGDQWHRMLIAMEKSIADAGMTPVVEVSNQETRNMLILAVDDILPDWLKATPAIVGAYKTTALTTQRLVKARAITEAKDKSKRAIQLVRPTPEPPPKPAVVPDTPLTQQVNQAPQHEPQGDKNVRISQAGKLIVPEGHLIR